MDCKTNQNWSEEETQCFLALWSSEEVQKREMGRSGSGRPKKNPFFDQLNDVLGDRPANNSSGALESATAMLEAVVDESVSQTATGDPGKKRKRDNKTTEIMDFLERQEERQTRRDEEQTRLSRAILEQMKVDSSTVSTLMGQMLSVMKEWKKD